ncbi:dynamin family protein [Arthroderma uncinatum]|uniref:dynamin family protein n=1 Tax=Arthroderma uncinatum TaxID=74035 RepID=UPI00144AAF29|nr:dynamin family protein [Arthroderma uncinatum]KAF3479533.1 dynamin family protein [Arthroderma uncinatum]
MGQNSGSRYDSLPINLLQAQEQSTLLERLDELRRLGLHHQVFSHKLVICGDQNSGKSAVFEAITGVPLPVNNGVSTRFVVEVVLRRAPDTSTQVKICPGPNASPDHRHKLGVFSRSHNWLSDIPKLFSEARLIMGLTREGAYSEDVLHLEMSGPTLPNLTIVDLPGLMYLPRDGQSAEDIDMANSLTETYLQNPRCIILAVISAERQLSEQMVLHMTRSCTARTMGIITKLDRLDPDASIIAKLYDRVKQQNNSLQLGWHLLKNMDSEGLERPPRVTRDDIEELFFSTVTPWRTLPPHSVGVGALRSRIRKILLADVKRQLSILSSDINIDLDTHRTLFEKLGTSNSTTIERRVYLARIGERFQSLTKAAVYGEYHDPYFRYRPTHSIRRLRATISNWTDDFAQDMRKRGHSYTIYDDASQKEAPPQSQDGPQPVTRSDFMTGLEEFAKQSKGREISGLMNAQVIGELFIRYSLRWKSIARAHVYQMWTKIKQFLNDLLHHIADASIGEALIHKIFNIEMEKKLQKLHDKIDEIVAPFKKVIPTIVDPELKQRISQLRTKANGKAGADGPESTPQSEILDCMLAYYSVALNNFINNIASLAVEGCLIDGLEDMISPSKFVQMSNDDIETLAAESQDVKLARSRLEKQVRMLELAAAACTRCELVALEATADNHRNSTESKESERSTGSGASSPASITSGSDTERFPPARPEQLRPEPLRPSSRQNHHNGQSGNLRPFPSQSAHQEKPTLLTNAVYRPPTGPPSPANDKLPPFSQSRGEHRRTDSKSKLGKLTKKQMSKFVSSISEE